MRIDCGHYEVLLLFGLLDVGEQTHEVGLSRLARYKGTIDLPADIEIACQRYIRKRPESFVVNLYVIGDRFAS